eukprot:TRINITY_DN25432_c0_g1_i1.p1 TRINITY_DN25432_c0_g1~~TRINITY_DN25432_c0_g1_i1.p1  ORF type:complete len:155 (+),score=12.47 TRINITY_DN25432_c0_g1_i1:251-715(+)
MCSTKLRKFRVSECRMYMKWEKEDDRKDDEESGDEGEENPVIEIRLKYEREEGKIKARVTGNSSYNMNSENELSGAVNEAVRRVKRRILRDRVTTNLPVSIEYHQEVASSETGERLVQKWDQDSFEMSEISELKFRSVLATGEKEDREKRSGTL